MSWLAKSARLIWRHAGVLSIGVFSGAIMTIGFHWSLEVTSTESFCIYCHEMRDNAFALSQSTTHFSNRTGIHVTCADCHEPRGFTARIARKIEAAREVYHTLLGTIDSPEKYAQRQPLMAQRVRTRLLNSDSAVCRSCHQNMNLSQQSAIARSVHSKTMNTGSTCIQCHQDVGHGKSTLGD